MRILFLTQVLPYPLDAGPKIRAYYTLRYLSRRHDVTLLSFVRPSDPPGAIEHLRVFCQAVHTVPMHRSRARDAWHLLRSLANGTPFLIARDWVPEMAQLVQALIEPGSQRTNTPTGNVQPTTCKFDVVHADQLWMAPYALLAKSQISNPKSKIVLDQHNAVYLVPKRLAERERNPVKHVLLELEWRKLVRYEAELCQLFDEVVFVTKEDQHALMGQIRNPVIPICVDPDEQQVIHRRPDAHRVTFLGGLHWPPNAAGVLWFARDVWPLVQQQVPRAVLTVIGKNPPPELTHHASRFTHRAPGVTNCEVTGYVDDPTPCLAETAAFIVPLHAGGGMRVKIVDAWSWGLPVVSTRVGAEGLGYKDGENLLIADTAEAFARSVVRLFTEPELADRLRAAGRRTVEEHYDWRKVYRAWDEVYGKAVSFQRGGD